MARKHPKEELELRRKRHRENFSNYENAVTLICSLEAWFEHRWGPHGKEHAGLLERFNRFPDEDGLTPDFEARFVTPYVIWGDHKRTIQPAERGRDEAIAQILRYAAHRPSRSAAEKPAPLEAVPSSSQQHEPNFDVMVLVRSENDNVAANAIELARKKVIEEGLSNGKERPQLAPIVVLGCHRDHESIEGEWYTIKWREHHSNHKFSTPNVSADSDVEDLNALLVGKSHHAIPVSRPALDLTGRNPFINDSPPPIYTAIRLVTPAINSVLSDEERDQLQSRGRIEKTLTRADLLGTELVRAMNPRPRHLEKWLEAALDFLASELSYVRKLPKSDPQKYVVTIDNALMKADLRELFSSRAAAKALKNAQRPSGKKGFKGNDPSQMHLFE